MAVTLQAEVGGSMPVDRRMGPGRGKRARGQPRGLPQVDPFLGWLIADQRETGETDEDYAARHDFSRPHFALAKKGVRGLSRQIVESICKADARAREAYVALCLTRYGGPRL
jgi:hypothetical protein